MTNIRKIFKRLSKLTYKDKVREIEKILKHHNESRAIANNEELKKDCVFDNKYWCNAAKSPECYKTCSMYQSKQSV